MSKTKTTQTATNTSTVTPTNPQPVTDATMGLVGNISNLAGRDPGSFFAGTNPTLQQGIDAFSGLGAQGIGWLTGAANMAGQQQPITAAQAGPADQASAFAARDGIAGYQNPFEAQVVQSTMGDLDRARQMTQNNNGQGAVAAGQYGGSRQGVLDARANEDFLRSVGSTLGNLRYQGFNTALGAADADANRQTQVGLSNAANAQQARQFDAQMRQQAALANQSNGLAGAQLLGSLGQYGLGGLLDAGQLQQGLDQQQAMAPLTIQQLLSGSLASLPTQQFAGQTVTSDGTQTATQKGGVGGLLSGALGGLGTLGFGLGSLGWSPFGGGK